MYKVTKATMQYRLIVLQYFFALPDHTVCMMFSLKGLLSDGSAIALKQLSAKSKQGSREFVTEIAMISALQHPHLVKLYGCCIEGDQLLLVYEYMENNSLARALFGMFIYRDIGKLLRLSSSYL